MQMWEDSDSDISGTERLLFIGKHTRSSRRQAASRGTSAPPGSQRQYRAGGDGEARRGMRSRRGDR